VTADPLREALEEIEPTLDPEVQPLVAALLANEPVENSWQAILQEIFDEA
jgi:hypothetical protein